MTRARALVAATLLGAAVLAGCSTASIEPDEVATSEVAVEASASPTPFLTATATATPVPVTPPGFGAARPVTVEGYDGQIMEPFVTRDGSLLIFNDENTPGTDTNLHVAARVDEVTFSYRGLLTAANSDELDAVASVGPDGYMYFVSVRSYDETRSTLYRVPVQGATVGDVELVPGMENDTFGIIHFDAEVSADGAELYYVIGEFSGRSIPDTADLAVAVRDGDRFRPLDDDRFAAVNTDALEYAPATSADGLLLFFTRVEVGGDTPRIWYSQRADRMAAWEPPTLVSEATGFVEAATIVGDDVWYHEKVDGRHELRHLQITRS